MKGSVHASRTDQAIKPRLRQDTQDPANETASASEERTKRPLRMENRVTIFLEAGRRNTPQSVNGERTSTRAPKRQDAQPTASVEFAFDHAIGCAAVVR